MPCRKNWLNACVLASRFAFPKCFAKLSPASPSGWGEAGEIAQGGIDIHGLNDLLTFGFFFIVGMVKRVVVV